MSDPSVLAAGVMNDYTSPNHNGAISQVDSTGAVHAGVVTEIDNDQFTNHDARVLNFLNNSAYKALVVDYYYSVKSVYGVFDPTVAGTWTLNPNKYFSSDNTTSNIWHTSNPYSIVTKGNDMYIMGYDQNTIVKIDMTNSNYTYTSTFYTYTPLTGKTGHGVDMDKVTIDGTDYIAALFINDDGSYANYGDSQLVLISLVDGSLYDDPINLNANANSLNIDANGQYAYVTSYGGPQQAGGNNGNPSSELQVVDIEPSSVIQTIGPTAAPVKTGDYVDVALVGSYAYVLTANYNDDYSQYTYMLVKAPQASLRNGNFSGNSSYTATVDSGATWLLAYDGTVLWFVAGKQVYTIDTSVAISSSALTLRANANDHSSDSQGLGISTAYGQLNTASVVIPYSAAAGVSRAAARSAVSGGHTKFAKVMLPREVLEKLGRA